MGVHFDSNASGTSTRSNDNVDYKYLLMPVRLPNQ